MFKLSGFYDVPFQRAANDAATPNANCLRPCTLNPTARPLSLKSQTCILNSTSHADVSQAFSCGSVSEYVWWSVKAYLGPKQGYIEDPLMPPSLCWQDPAQPQCFPVGPCYGPLLDSGGVCSMGPYFVRGI